MSFENPYNKDSEDSKRELEPASKVFIPEILNSNEEIPYERVRFTWEIRILTHIKDFFLEWLGKRANEMGVEFTLNEKSIGIVESNVTIELKGQRKAVDLLVLEMNKYLKDKYDRVNNPSWK